MADEHASSKAKASGKLHETLPKDGIIHNHPSPNLISKKKRRIDDLKDDIIPSRATASNALANLPSPSSKPFKKRKVAEPVKEPVNTRTSVVGVLSAKKAGKDAEDVGTSAEQKKNREVITKIVRSTADRAKSARANAATMFKARKIS